MKMEITTFQQAKNLPNLLEYDRLIKTFLPFTDPNELMDSGKLSNFYGSYTLIPSDMPEVMLEDIIRLFKLKVIAVNLDDGFSISPLWNLIQLNKI